MSRQRAYKRVKDCHNSLSSAKLKKATAGKENYAIFFVDETNLSLGCLVALHFLHVSAR